MNATISNYLVQMGITHLFNGNTKIPITKSHVGNISHQNISIMMFPNEKDNNVYIIDHMRDNRYAVFTANISRENISYEILYDDVYKLLIIPYFDKYIICNPANITLSVDQIIISNDFILRDIVLPVSVLESI